MQPVFPHYLSILVSMCLFISLIQENYLHLDFKKEILNRFKNSRTQKLHYRRQK